MKIKIFKNFLNFFYLQRKLFGENNFHPNLVIKSTKSRKTQFFSVGSIFYKISKISQSTIKHENHIVKCFKQLFKIENLQRFNALDKT